jgi:hypothetical protein
MTVRTVSGVSVRRVFLSAAILVVKVLLAVRAGVVHLLYVRALDLLAVSISLLYWMELSC